MRKKQRKGWKKMEFKQKSLQIRPKTPNNKRSFMRASLMGNCMTKDSPFHLLQLQSLKTLDNKRALYL